MKKNYTITFDETVKRYKSTIVITADSFEEAKEKFNSGDFDSDDVDNGSEEVEVDFVSIEETIE